MICVAALCRTSNSPLLKLNTAMTYEIGTKALSAILDAMKLIRSPPVDSCSEYVLSFFKYECDMILTLDNRHTFNWLANAPT